MLAVNARIAHFIDNQNPDCTLCGGGEAETFFHLFYSCRVTSSLRNLLATEHINELINSSEQTKRTFWLCGIYKIADNVPQMGTMVLAILFNSFIWETKIKKTRMSFASLMMYLDSNMLQCVSLSSKLAHFCRTSDLTIFRRWCRRLQVPGIREEDEQNRERRE
jgi:hypothetical protein